MQARAVGSAILFFHGGGFVISDIETHDALCQRFADASGVRVVFAAYGLAPEHPFPSQVDDARAALAWLVDQAGEFGSIPIVWPSPATARAPIWRPPWPAKPTPATPVR